MAMVYTSLKDANVKQRGTRRSLSSTRRRIFSGRNSPARPVFMNPELLVVGEAKLRTFLAADPGLAPYRFPIMEVLRSAPHTLGAEAEGVLFSLQPDHRCAARLAVTASLAQRRHPMAEPSSALPDGNRGPALTSPATTKMEGGAQPCGTERPCSRHSGRPFRKLRTERLASRSIRRSRPTGFGGQRPQISQFALASRAGRRRHSPSRSTAP